MMDRLIAAESGVVKWPRVAFVAGFLNVIFAGLLHYIQIDGPFYFRPFSIGMGLISIFAIFGLGYGAVMAYSQYRLYLPAAILTIFFSWSLTITFYHFPGDIFAGPIQGFDPFSVRPVPYIFKWIPMSAVIIIFGGAEFLIQRLLDNQ